MAIDKTKLLDPIDLELQSKYREQGITYISNNNSVVKRDDSGNIILNEGKQNPLLVIQPVNAKIINSSVTKVIDTQFNYFKFPVRVIQSPIDLDLDVEFGTDMAYARYKPTENIRLEDPLGPEVSAAIRPVELPFDRVVRGNIQENLNRYTINEEIKNSGINLRFNIKIQHRFDSTQSQSGVSYFYISKEGPDSELQKDYLGPFANTSATYPDRFGSIGQYQVQTLNINRVIENSEFEIGDTFFISAIGDPFSEFNFHTVNSAQSYWIISDADKNVDGWNQEVE